MFDVVQAQEDLTGLLLSTPALDSVQIRSYRKMRLQQELDFRAALSTPRAGRCGAAIIVAQPEASGRNPNVTGPVLDWSFPIIAIEEPNTNFHPTLGTLLAAEELAQIILDTVHLHADHFLGTFYVENPAIKPEPELELPGTIAYRTNFHIVGKSGQTPRCKPVLATTATGQCFLTCATEGAEIRFTTDETFPGTGAAGNPASQAYVGPFAVAVGQVIRAAAYKNGLNASAITYHVIS